MEAHIWHTWIRKDTYLSSIMYNSKHRVVTPNNFKVWFSLKIAVEFVNKVSVSCLQKKKRVAISGYKTITLFCSLFTWCSYVLTTRWHHSLDQYTFLK